MSALLLRIRTFFIDVMQISGDAGEDWIDNDISDNEGERA